MIPNTNSSPGVVLDDSTRKREVRLMKNRLVSLHAIIGNSYNYTCTGIYKKSVHIYDETTLVV